VSRLCCAALATALLVVSADSEPQAQTAQRRLTTIEALRQFPGYFHLQTVLLRGEFAENRSRVSLRAGDHEIGVLLNKVNTIAGPVEVRGQLIDVGRLEPSDPRLAGYRGEKDTDRWPRPGEELLLSITGVTASPPTTSSSVRALALEPWRFEGQAVTVIGQFRGRNLFGDLPGAPAKSNYDFVLRAADSAVWVTGLRPRGKGFDLSVDARVDTNQWLQVTGVVRRDRGLVMIEAKTLIAAKAPAAEPPPDEEPALAQLELQPVEVVFSSPTEGDVDVPVNEPVRIQFSRGLNPGTLSGRIRIAYLTAPRTPEQTSAIETQSSYDVGTRAVQIKFVRPLDRFRTVRVEILEGMKAFDGADVKPWALMFTTGG
jgi:hypothetical protein